MDKKKRKEGPGERGRKNIFLKKYIGLHSVAIGGLFGPPFR